MSKGRLEAFSDGVIAILITIMVLELRAPVGTAWASLIPSTPTLLSYVLSYVFLGIYWSNHHHLFQAVRIVDGRVLWANLHLLFWLSLIPYATAWMGSGHFASVPVAFYGLVLLFAACAYYILAHVLIRKHGRESVIAQALGYDWKGKISVIIYGIAVVIAFSWPWAAFALYVLVSIIWLVPDRRIENALRASKGE